MHRRQASPDLFAQWHHVARGHTQRDLHCGEDPALPVLLARFDIPLKNREATFQ
jgi:hypothetical protein